MLSFLKTVGNRVHGFFIGPRPHFMFYRPGDGWYFQLGACVYWNSAPGFHFDSIGIELMFGPWIASAAWVDNN